MKFYLVGVTFFVAENVVTENASPEHRKVVDNNYAV